MSKNTADAAQIDQFFSDLRDHSVEPVKAALEAGFPADALDDQRTSALNVAAEAGFTEGVKLLLAHGANINQRNNTSTIGYAVPLNRAIIGNQHEVIEALLSAGADPRLTDEEGRNAIHYFVESNLLSHRWNTVEGGLEIVLSLFKRALSWKDVANRQESKEGRTPLQVALGRTPHPSVVEALLKHGASAEIASSYGLKAVHRPWQESNQWMLAKLVEHGADLNTQNREGASALHYAFDADTVHFMLTHGADVHHVDYLGRNTLALLLDSRTLTVNWLPVATALVMGGIDTEQRDFTGASVKSRLTALGTTEAAQLATVIAARQARDSMARVHASSPGSAP